MISEILILLQDEIAERIIELLSAEINEFDIIIINQQVQSGIHTPIFREKLLNLVRTYTDKLFISDIRDPDTFYPGTILKLNEKEAFKLSGLKIPDTNSFLYSDIEKTAQILFEKWKKPAFVTCGSKGSIAIDNSGIIKVHGLMHLGRIDPVGAGDSYLAGVAVTLAAGYNIEIAANLGSLIAGVTVQKLFQTGTATPEEVLQIGTDPDYIYEPELAVDLRKAKFYPNSEIEIINSWPANTEIKYAIFDHDGTISTLREGWEQIMAPMMIKAIMGDKYLSADESLYNKVKERVAEMIDKTTGIQTLMQMSILIDLIKEFNIIPKNEILDTHGYKKIYNDELIRLVKERENKLTRHELSVEDFTIKNAVKFLQNLYIII